MAELRDRLPANAAALIDQARDAERAGQPRVARAHYEAALRALTSRSHARAAAELLRWIGSSHVAEGDFEAAFDCCTVSYEVARLNDDAENMASALNGLAIANQQWGRLDDATELYDRARELAVSVEDWRLTAMIDQNMGTIANIRGDFPRARDHYRRSIESYRQLGEERYLSQVLNNLGMLHVDLGEWDEAERVFDEAADVSARTKDPQARVMVETNRTELHILKKDFDGAREHCDAAFELASRYDHHLGVGEAYKNYGIIYRDTGKYRLAETHLETALEIAERHTNPLLEAEVQRELARVYRSMNRNPETLQALNRAHRVFTDLRARLDLADVHDRLKELEEIFLEVVRRWGESIESKDRYTAGHCERVAEYGCMLARAAGFDEQTITWFRMGAFLHDVGKTMVPEEILNKQGKLSEDEWDIMRRHTLLGEELLSPIEFPWDIRPMVRSHHERWDGSGYPDGLAGKQIPLSARILCIADVFDALTTTRSYRAAFEMEDALQIMTEDSGRIFDPELFREFEPLVRRHYEEVARAAPAVRANGGDPADPDDEPPAG